ncbi:hypothetical protein Tco_0888888, partial [Tanacetum coccineum]
MASDSTSSQQSQQLRPSSKVTFKCEDGIIAFNNVVALLEHSNELYKPMLSFLSDCCINKALTLQPSAMYVEYLQEFWYTTEVEEEPKPSPSHFHEPEQSLIPPSGETKKKRIPPSSKPKSPYKVSLLKKQVAEIQHAEVTVATTDPTKSLVASKLAEVQVNQPSAVETEKVLDQNVEEKVKDARFVAMETVAEEQSLEILTVEQLLDEADKLNKDVQVTLESPCDTESKIKIVKSFFIGHVSEIQDQIMHDSEDIQEDSDYESIPEDDLTSVSGFEASDDTQRNDVSYSDYIFQDDNASAERLSLPDHMDHICEELTTALQEQLPGLLSASLKDCLPSIIQESLQTPIPASSEQFAKKQTKLNKKNLSSALKSDMGQLVTSKVQSGMQDVRDNLNSRVKSLGKFCLDVQSMYTQLNDIQNLLDLAVIVNDTAEGEKNKKAKDAYPASTQ